MRARSGRPRATRASGGRLDPELANRLFRSAHSLKGIAGMFGFEGVSDLAHHMEDILDGLRMGRLPPGSPALALLDEGVDARGGAARERGTATAPPARSRRSHALIERIIAALASDADARCGRRPRRHRRHRCCARSPSTRSTGCARACARGRAIHLVEASFEILSFEEGLSELTRSVRELGEVLSTLPAPGDSPDSQIRFSLLVATRLRRRASSAAHRHPERHGARAAREPAAPARRRASAHRRASTPAESPSDASLGESARADGGSRSNR